MFHWFYPALNAHQAHHFVSETFGDIHSLSLVGETGDDYHLAFCPRGRELPSIGGTLVVSRDSTLISAAWTYRTPDPDEGAGGEVFFAVERIGS